MDLPYINIKSFEFLFRQQIGNTLTRIIREIEMRT